MTLAEKMRDELIEAYSELIKDRDRLEIYHAQLKRLVAEISDDIVSIDVRLTEMGKFIEENGLNLDNDNEVIAFKKEVSS